MRPLTFSVPVDTARELQLLTRIAQRGVAIGQLNLGKFHLRAEGQSFVGRHALAGQIDRDRVEAMRCGGKELVVDAVLCIGEHGNYPTNDIG